MGKAKKVCYAITRCTQADIGIYDQWDDVRERVSGVSGARFKGFLSYAEAYKHMEEMGIQRWPLIRQGVRSWHEPREQPAGTPSYCATMSGRQPEHAGVSISEWDNVQHVKGVAGSPYIKTISFSVAHDNVKQGVKKWEENVQQYHDHVQQDREDHVQHLEDNLQRYHEPRRLPARTAPARKARQRYPGAPAYYAIARGARTADIGIYRASSRDKVVKCTNGISGANFRGCTSLEAARKFMAESCLVQWHEPDGTIFNHVPATPSEDQESQYMYYRTRN